jgi:hypothetical protein
VKSGLIKQTVMKSITLETRENSVFPDFGISPKYKDLPYLCQPEHPAFSGAAAF